MQGGRHLDALWTENFLLHLHSASECGLSLLQATLITIEKAQVVEGLGLGGKVALNPDGLEEVQFCLLKVLLISLKEAKTVIARGNLEDERIAGMEEVGEEER